MRWGPHSSYSFAAPLFGSATPLLGQVVHPELIGPTLSFVNSSLEGWKRAPLPPLPPEEPLLDVGRDGVSTSLAQLVGQALDLAPLYAAPAHFGDPPAEHEMVAHYVVPLLRALGWQPEQVRWSGGASTWRSFTACPRTPEAPCLHSRGETATPGRREPFGPHTRLPAQSRRRAGCGGHGWAALSALCSRIGIRAGGVCEFGAVEGIDNLGCWSGSTTVIAHERLIGKEISCPLLGTKS